MPELRTIDPSKVTLTIDGTVITGFADGTFITAEVDEDTYDLVIGIQGHSLRVKRAGRPGTITFRLLPTSPAIAYIRSLEASEKPVTIVCTDSNDGVDKGFVAEEAWLVRPAPFVRSKDAGGNVVEVRFRTHFLTFNV